MKTDYIPKKHFYTICAVCFSLLTVMQREAITGAAASQSTQQVWNGHQVKKYLKFRKICS